MDERGQIDEIRKGWGRRLLILGHHYQNPDVLRHADAVGDSLELARRAASEQDAERIAFCGVHFMAESADMLTGQRQEVYMPDTSAGCPMASMARAEQVRHAWSMLEAAGGGWLPVVYVNSTAEIKALCGQWGGSTCTSSNAGRVLEWVFGQGRRPFFLPDEHLGANTASDLGIADERVSVYDPKRPHGGLTPEAVRDARMVVWKGYCHVHTSFTADDVRQARTRWPDAKIIVHPETPKEVLRLCDAHGSTSQIIAFVEAAAPGSTVVIGTEARLVERLAAAQQGRVAIRHLAHSMCPNMAKTTEAKLGALLRDWPERNRVCVAPPLAADARLALERMLAL